MSKLIMTLEFGTSKVICAIGRKRTRGRFEVVSFSTVSYPGIKRGQWRSLDSIPAVLKKAVTEATASIKRQVDAVYIGIPACFTRVHSTSAATMLDDNETVTQEVIDAMMAEAAAFDVPDEYRLVEQMPVYFKLDEDNLFIDPLGMDAVRVEGKFAFIFANEAFLHEISTMINLMNIEITGFKPEILAQALFLIPVEARDSASVLLDIGYFDTSVSIAYGDTIIFTRTIHAGGAQIAGDLALVLDIDLDAAERLKRRFTFDAGAGKQGKELVRTSDGRMVDLDRNVIDEIVRARAGHLCRLINRALEQSDVALSAETDVYLTGGGIAMMDGAIGYLSDTLNKHVILPEIEAVSYSTPNYFNAIGMLDYLLTNEVG